jgi:hypothetical protein
LVGDVAMAGEKDQRGLTTGDSGHKFMERLHDLGSRHLTHAVVYDKSPLPGGTCATEIVPQTRCVSARTPQLMVVGKLDVFINADKETLTTSISH